MKDSSYHILRVGIAITFLWIGLLIFKEPEAWGAFLQPWAAGILPMPIEQAMTSTAVLDLLIGLALLLDFYVWLAALLGMIHLVIVLTVSGINPITVRDIGLLTGTFALLYPDLKTWWEKREL
ncbi:DoxX family membrane protein [Candidatus Uhrbacteria bacterium]|nr:DoxX family membrane protein [Candidatus Uhrbacteria bacterium]